MRTFEYARASTVDEAPGMVDGAHALQNGKRFLAGGTDLLTLMKADVVQPSLLVDIKRAEGLPRGIEETKDGLTLGALVTLGEIERHEAIAERYRALWEAVRLAATPQLRNMATIGGNLLQRPRCWYYRSSLFHCWLKGGTECQARDGENQHHALFGESPCVAVHPSDAASALLALGATVRLRGSAGERTLSLEELFAEPTEERRTETVIRPDELLLDVSAARPGERRSEHLPEGDGPQGLGVRAGRRGRDAAPGRPHGRRGADRPERRRADPLARRGRRAGADRPGPDA